MKSAQSKDLDIRKMKIFGVVDETRDWDLAPFYI
jgi:hypothetical protein